MPITTLPISLSEYAASELGQFLVHLGRKFVSDRVIYYKFMPLRGSHKDPASTASCVWR